MTLEEKKKLKEIVKNTFQYVIDNYYSAEYTAATKSVMHLWVELVREFDIPKEEEIEL